MAEQGFAGTSISMVCRRSGLPPSSTYWHFGSKEGLVRAVLAKARAEELRLLDQVGEPPSRPIIGLAAAVERLWGWLAAPEHRQLLTLWAETYAGSLVEPGGAWGGFAAATVHDWLAVLAACQPAEERDGPDGAARRTLALAVLRGALLDLLATADQERVSAAVHHQLGLLRSS